MAHQPQRLIHLAFGKDIEERGLLELHGQGLLECPVENCVSGGVGEIGEHDKILLAKFVRGTMRAVVIEAKEREHQNNESCRGAAHHFRESGRGKVRCSSGIGLGTGRSQLFRTRFPSRR